MEDRGKEAASKRGVAPTPTTDRLLPPQHRRPLPPLTTVHSLTPPPKFPSPQYRGPVPGSLDQELKSLSLGFVERQQRHRRSVGGFELWRARQEECDRPVVL